MSDDRNKYTVGKLSLPEQAEPLFADLSLSEVRKSDHRTIGGDKGDLWFCGYTLENGETVLYEPVLVTIHELNDDEVQDMAEEILQASYESIGVETVEHS